MRNLIKNTGIIIIIFLLTLIIYSAIISIPRMEYKDHKYYYIYQDYMECPYTKNELKTMVSELFDTPHIYAETNYDSRNIAALRIIKISNKSHTFSYVKQYAHELTHVKYQTKDERFTVYKTITTLYESNNEYLQWVAVDYANEFLTKSNNDKDYDCGYYLLNYFTFK